MLKAPYVWFGGKAPVAAEVWRRFGDVPNYVEPFFGSGAILLGRPPSRTGGRRVETINDFDAYVTNCWRAVAADPAGVAAHAAYILSALDLHARHDWLVGPGRRRVERLRSDPDYYSVKVAGWWLWGIAIWIGRGWCADKKASHQLPLMTSCGIARQSLVGGGRAETRRNLTAYMHQLADRVRDVRVCCGDFVRVLQPSVVIHSGTPTGVFLDPPYADAEHDVQYAAKDGAAEPPAVRARAWCLENGGDRRLRIALCGYAGEGHEILEDSGWRVYAWKAKGGYGNQGEDNANAKRERIWFSPHCLHTRPGELGFLA